MCLFLLLIVTFLINLRLNTKLTFKRIIFKLYFIEIKNNETIFTY